jgi:hypothetical protein
VAPAPRPLIIPYSILPFTSQPPRFPKRKVPDAIEQGMKIDELEMRERIQKALQRKNSM